jgi:predicted phosphodiesterase
MNDIISRLKKINNAYIIKGNGEERLIRAIKENPPELNGKQYAPLHWFIKNTTNEDIHYFESLPDKVSFQIDNLCFNMAHAPHQHFGYGIADSISGRTYRDEVGHYYSNHNEYLKYVKIKLRNDNAFIENLFKLPKGIYLFCHYHTQWYDEIDGRILINPGSCGQPLDYDLSAPYTILDTNGGLTIIERRVMYDFSVALKALEESDIKKSAAFWHRLLLLMFKNSKEEMVTFLEFVDKYAKDKCYHVSPYSDSFWDEAVALYNNEYLLVNETREHLIDNNSEIIGGYSNE